MSLVVDSHVYCFPPGDDPAGYATFEERRAWLQISQGLHHQPTWRVRDRTPAPLQELGRETPSDWSGLPDVDFRIDRQRGRVV